MKFLNVSLKVKNLGTVTYRLFTRIVSTEKMRKDARGYKDVRDRKDARGTNYTYYNGYF